MTERFNRTARDCPVCLRTGTLVGRIDPGAVTQCSGCAACFRVDGATLERLAVAHPTGVPVDRRPSIYRPSLRADEPCATCGLKHCRGHAEERLR
jgi:hypothetical protein